MTREEATIQDAIHCVKVDLEEAVCEECRLYGLCHTICKDADRIKLEALEKQIPKKPLEDRMIQTGYWDCPICRHLVDMSANYCEHCGQALDWTEEGE